jgi:cell division protein FtsB
MIMPKKAVDSKFKYKLVSWIFLVLALLFGFSILKNILRINRVNEEIANKETDVERLKVKNSELQKKIEELGSEVYIESQIRNNLGLVKEGEVVVVLPDPEVLRKLAPVHEIEEKELPQANWKKWLNLFL